MRYTRFSVLICMMLGLISCNRTQEPPTQSGKVLGTAVIKADMPQEYTELTISVPEAGKLKGKHAIFLEFESETKDKFLCALESLVFN